MTEGDKVHGGKYFFRGRKKAAAKNLASKYIIIKNYTGNSKFYNQKNRSENKFSLIFIVIKNYAGDRG